METFTNPDQCVDGNFGFIENSANELFILIAKAYRKANKEKIKERKTHLYDVNADVLLNWNKK